ncbi:MAG: molecular chaperone GrpE [Limisphaerales bacterium]|jgi:molecular chaperone GrpE
MSKKTVKIETETAEETPSAESEVEIIDEASAEENAPQGAGDDESSGDAGTEAEEGALDPQTVTVEQVMELIEQAGQAQKNYEKWVRLSADFENYKKRALRDKTEALKYANESLIERLLPVLDNFDAALISMNNESAASLDSVKMGVNMIASQLKNLLTDCGLQEIDAIGQPFDPNLHEAVSQKETAEVPESQVVEQFRRGYKLKDRLVRAANVAVSKAPSSEGEATEEATAETSDNE